MEPTGNAGQQLARATLDSIAEGDQVAVDAARALLHDVAYHTVHELMRALSPDKPVDLTTSLVDSLLLLEQVAELEGVPWREVVFRARQARVGSTAELVDALTCTCNTARKRRA